MSDQCFLVCGLEVTYQQFLVPGMVVMVLIQNGFQCGQSKLMSSIMDKTVKYLLISPSSKISIVIGYVIVSSLQSLIAGIFTAIALMYWAPPTISNIFLLIVFSLLITFICSSVGMFVALVSKSFYSTGGIQMFVIMPLVFFSGVFYDVSRLPDYLQIVTHLNPLYYLVDSFRGAFIGASNTHYTISLAFCIITSFLLLFVNVRILNKRIFV